MITSLESGAWSHGSVCLDGHKGQQSQEETRLPEEVTQPGQRAGSGEEDAVLTQFLHFFHASCSVDWTLQQAEPQEGEKKWK